MMALRSIAGLGAEDALRHIAGLTEASLELRRPEGLSRCIALAGELQRRELTPIQNATLNYYIANAWENLRLMERRPASDVWLWEQEAVEKGLFHLRLALDPGALKDMPRERVARALSNLAATLNHVGRFCEALEYWDRALSVQPSFSLARGKKGYALTHFAHILYQREHAEIFLKYAHAELNIALSLGGMIDEVRDLFIKRLTWIESRFSAGSLGAEVDFHGASECSSEAEAIYRRWCLENRLFLNPLNDLGPFPIAARDSMNVPPWVSASGRGAYFHGFFNQIKQAYVSARYMYFEGVSAGGPHFADRGVLLFDTRDCATHSLSAEKVKAAFFMAYSLFDKTASFINQYMRLGLPREGVSLRTLWYRGGRRDGGLRAEFEMRRNWPLRGLFWLSKDLYEPAPGFDEPIEPGARELSDIRYHMQHMYLRLYEDGASANPLSSDTSAPPRGLQDMLAHSVHRGDFEARTLRLLKMARSALMYICFAMHAEEREYLKAVDGDSGIALLDIIDDSMKV